MVTIFAGVGANPLNRDTGTTLQARVDKAGTAADPARTPLYVRHQTAADLAAWSVARDIAWDRVMGAGRATPSDTLDALREACLAEAGRLVAVGRLAGVVADDLDSSVASSIVLSESVKHFQALRLYLEAVGHEPALTDADVDCCRRTALGMRPPTEAVESVVGLLLAEHLASGQYRSLAARTEDPVLRDLLRLIAADKVRHARMATDVLERWTARAPSLATRVGQAAAAIAEAGYRHRPPPGGRATWPNGHAASVRTLVNRLERISTDALNRGRGVEAPHGLLG